jgi:hypothetical protein
VNGEEPIKDDMNKDLLTARSVVFTKNEEGEEL